MASERDVVNLQYDRQRELAQEQNAWQSQENALDAQRQYDYWLKMFTEQNEYNSPSAQVARLQAAGINPSALASQLGGMLSSGGGSASVPGSHSVTPYNYSAPMGVSSDAAMFSSIAQLNDSLSKAAQTGLNVERQKAMLNAEVDNMIADTTVKREAATQSSLQNEITRLYGKDKAGQQLINLINESQALMAKKDYDSASAKYYQALEQLTSDDTVRKRDSFPVALALMKKQGQVMDSEIIANGAKASESYSRASYNNALTETENLLREGKFTAQDLSNKLADVQRQMAGRQNVRDMQTSSYQVQAVIDMCEREGLINRQSKQKIEKMITDNQWNNVEHAVGVLSDVVGTVGSVTSAGAAWKSAGAAVDRNAVSREFNSYLNDYWNGETFTDEMHVVNDGVARSFKHTYKHQ